MSSTFGPLSGTKVIDLTRFPPGAYCTLLLSDLGADVIRIDPPASAGRRSSGAEQVGLRRGKRSIALDTRRSEATDVLRRLATSADVFVENARPGDMEARGFGYAQAAVEFPALIWCSISGFGQDGPYSQRAGHDLTYMAHSGLLAALNPELPWHPQAMLSVPLGATMAAMGVLAALVERARTGQGCQIDASLAEAATWILSGDDSQLTEQPYGLGHDPGRRLYECGDGEFISVAAAEPRTWAALCTALGFPDLAAAAPLTTQEAATVTEQLAAVFRTKDAKDWVDELGPLNAAVGAVNRGTQIVDDPHNLARETTVEVAGVRVPANPVRLRDVAGPRSSTSVEPPPEPGAHTDLVLGEAGFTSKEIERMREQGIVG